MSGAHVLIEARRTCWEMHYGFIYASDPRLHWHQGVHGSEGGMNRSTWAQKYPDQMCLAIVEAVKVHIGMH